MIVINKDGTATYVEDVISAEAANPYEGLSYEDLIVMFIREKYSVNDELAILRQRDTKPEEFSTYNAFCEDCKARAKEIIGGAP